jgi:hypothetical protein
MVVECQTLPLSPTTAQSVADVQLMPYSARPVGDVTADQVGTGAVGFVDVKITPPSPTAKQLVVEAQLTPRRFWLVTDGAPAQVAPDPEVAFALVVSRIVPSSPTATHTVLLGHDMSRIEFPWGVGSCHVQVPSPVYVPVGVRDRPAPRGVTLPIECALPLMSPDPKAGR